MIKLPTMRLSTKLPVFITMFCLIMTTSLATISYFNFRSTLLAEAEYTFEAVAGDRKKALEAWLKSVNTDLASLAESPATVEAMQKFNAAWQAIEGNQKTELQAAYIMQNPNPAGQKHLLDRASEQNYYNSVHNNFHPALRTFQQLKGYYDIFLLNPEGDLVYSVFKESDFGTNFQSGLFAASGLGIAFRETIQGAAGEIHAADFAAYAPSNGAGASFVATKVVNRDGTVLGVLALQMPTTHLLAITNGTEGLGNTGQVYLVDENFIARSPSRFEGGHEMLDAVSPNEQIEAGLNGVHEVFHNAIGLTGVPSMASSYTVDFHEEHWALVAEQDLSEILAPVYALRTKLIILTLVFGAIVTLVGWLFARSITRPIARVGEAMQHVANDDFDTDIIDANRKDEVGIIAQKLVQFRDELKMAKEADLELEKRRAQQKRVVEALSIGLVDMSQGNFARSINEPFVPEYEKLRADFNKTLESLRSTVSDVVETSGSIKHGAIELGQSSDDLASRTENQAATLEETAAALDQMTGIVKSAAEGAKTVEDVVKNARSEAETSGAVVESAVAAMTEIEESSEQISQIIRVIDDIAFQTNLLALNAGVEAARAGDAGKGFAVVASEVRALAQRSSEAAKEIKTLISSSSQQVEKGVELVGKAGEALSSIVEQVTNISTHVSQIAEGATEQSTGLQEINAAVNQLEKVTQQNAAMVEESTAACHLLNSDTSALSELVSHFQIGEANANPSNIVTFTHQKLADTAPQMMEEPETIQQTADGYSPSPQEDPNKIWEDF